MNKAVRDVVIELEAEWPAGYVMSVYVNDYEVCYGEFNTSVDSLSHHVGKELFQQYLAADKKECEYIATPADLLDENSRQSKVARIGDLLRQH